MNIQITNTLKHANQQRLPIEQALLGFLMRESAHGYDLHHYAEEALGRTWRIGISNTYTALKRLERAGHVEATVDTQGNRPARKVYRITPAGRESFLAWVHRPVPTMRAVRVEFLAKLYFLQTLDLEGSDELLAAQEALCRQRLERFTRIAATYEPHAFDRLVFDFRQRQIEAVLTWLHARREQTSEAEA